MENLDEYLKEISKRELLTRDQERSLSRRAQAGDEDAVATLAERNTRFVVDMAKKYHRRTGLAIPDLISVGNVGLMRAASKFDAEKHDIKFISYAVWWIRQAIIEYKASFGQQVHWPLNANYDRIRAFSTVQDLMDAGAAPTQAYAIAAERLRAEDTAKADSAEKRTRAQRRWTADHVRFLVEHGREVSLDAPLGDGETPSARAERFDIKEDYSVEDLADGRFVLRALERRFEAYERRYGHRDLEIIYLHAGVPHPRFNAEGEELRLEDIAERLNVSRARVGQLRERAYQRLREEFCLDSFREYVA